MTKLCKDKLPFPLTGTTNFEQRHGIKNILITGGAGFIGSYVVRHFVGQYSHYNIIVLDKLDYCASMRNLEFVEGMKNYAFELGDVTDSSRVCQIMKKHDIDSIMHFAAQSHVDLSFGNSYDFTHNNVMGTHVLLECSKHAGVKLFIHVSTDEVYGEVDSEQRDLLETAILAPSNPYAASKAAAEMIVNAYYKSFKIPIIIVRSNNVYGPYQYPEKIIPKTICLLGRNRKAIVHGDGSPVRRYLFACDVIDAFDTIFHKGEVGQVYNIGSKDEISNVDLVKMLLKKLKPNQCDDDDNDEKWIEYSPDRPYNDQRYAVDSSKLAKLGWKQRMSLDEGIDIAIEWYLKSGETWWGDISHCLTAFPSNK